MCQQGVANPRDDPEQPDQSEQESAHAGGQEREPAERAKRSTGNAYLGMDVLEGCAVDSRTLSEQEAIGAQEFLQGKGSHDDGGVQR